MKPQIPNVSREDALKCVGPGWRSLVEAAYNKKDTISTPIIIIQVKEKWGGLRIYSAPMNNEFDLVITDLEKQSYTICEKCGAAGSLRKNISGWYITLCEEHANGAKPINPFEDND